MRQSSRPNLMMGVHDPQCCVLHLSQRWRLQRLLKSVPYLHATRSPPLHRPLRRLSLPVTHHHPSPRRPPSQTCLLSPTSHPHQSGRHATSQGTPTAPAQRTIRLTNGLWRRYANMTRRRLTSSWTRSSRTIDCVRSSTRRSRTGTRRVPRRMMRVSSTTVHPYSTARRHRRSSSRLVVGSCGTSTRSEPNMTSPCWPTTNGGVDSQA